jgi:hypothetical protein
MELELQPKRYFNSKSILRQNQINLNCSIENADACEYEIKLIEIQGQTSNLVYTSSKKTPNQNQTILFDDDILMTFKFHQGQKLLIVVNKNGTNYEIQTTLGKIIISGQSKWKEKIQNDGKDILVISYNEIKQGDTVSTNEELISLFLVAANPGQLFSSKVNRFCFIIISNNDEYIYQSEIISPNGTFQTAEIPLHLLSPEFKITFQDHTSNPIVSFSTTLELFLEPKGLFHHIPFPLNGNIVEVINYSYHITPYSFMDYISSQIQIRTMIALDYTGSNGAPSSNTSLHFIQKKKLNDYERTIHEIGGYLSTYDEAKKIPVFGFGARAPGESNVSMCFNLNMTSSPYIEGITNVLKEYRTITPQLYFSGPTHFSKIITKCIELIKNDKGDFKYYVLTILTDGNTDDTNETKELLIKASTMPLSIVIIGIGKASFNLIEDLTEDNHPLVSKNGKVSRRKNASFIKLIEYKNDWGKIMNKILYQIPRQFIDYCSIYGVEPKK